MSIVRIATTLLAAAVMLGAGHAVAGSSADSEKETSARGASQGTFVRLSGMVGRELVDASGQVLGEIEEYVVDSSGQAHAVIAVGGFLGIAESEVLVPHTSIALSPTAQDLLVYRGKPSELQRAPAFERTQDALRLTASERKLLLEVREQSEDVAEARRQLQEAKERLRRERRELIAAEEARERAGVGQ